LPALIIVAPRPFAEDFAHSAALELALERFVVNLERFAAGRFGEMASVVDVRREIA
jgi:hypothetical protein